MRRRRGALAVTELTGLLAEIADEIGRDAALDLAAVAGGMQIFIPGRVPHGHWLEAAIGRDKAERLSDHFTLGGASGVSIKLPLGPYTRDEVLRERIAALDATGTMSANEIARACQCSVRTVHRHRERARDGQVEPRPDLNRARLKMQGQLDLFE